MRVLYVAHKYDYGDPKLGYGFEHYNFFETLRRLGCDVLYFDMGGLERRLGRARASRRLVEVARAERPEVMFTVLFEEELDPVAVREISEGTETVTFNWFCDDHWRFEAFSSRWAPCFNWVSTTARSALPKYEAIGLTNVIKTQWAANHFTYRPPDGAGFDRTPHGAVDLSFVGRSYGLRPILMDRLSAEGMPVEHFGPNAARGKIDQDGMVDLFWRSRINLNFSGSSVTGGPMGLGGRAKQAVGRAARRLGLKKAAIGVHRALGGQPRAVAEKRTVGEATDQIKGRNFEVPACGGFLLTGMADDLPTYYEVGREVVVYESEDDLVEKCRHYLREEDERLAIAKAGYERTVRDHTYAQRLREIFERIGWPLGDAGGQPGEVVEVGPGDD